MSPPRKITDMSIKYLKFKLNPTGHLASLLAPILIIQVYCFDTCYTLTVSKSNELEHTQKQTVPWP